MIAPMLEGSTTAPDGRRIAYTERGDLSGPPAFLHHGTPGARISGNPDDGAYAGMRVICQDRPGYGQSDRLHGRDVAAVADDVRVLADALEIDHFGLIGVSGGGPHALACAALLPDRVTRVGVLVGAAPADDPEFDFMEGMAELNVREFKAAQESDEAYAKVLAPLVELLRTTPDAVVEMIEREVPEADRAVLAQERWRSAMIRSLVEAVRQGDAGWLDDGRAFTRAWGFPLSDVRAETKVWQGELDVLVPRAHGDYLARKLPNAEFELVPNEGHMLVSHTPIAFGWLAEAAAP